MCSSNVAVAGDGSALGSSIVTEMMSPPALRFSPCVSKVMMVKLAGCPTVASDRPSPTAWQSGGNELETVTVAKFCTISAKACATRKQNKKKTRQGAKWEGRGAMLKQAR